MVSRGRHHSCITFISHGKRPLRHDVIATTPNDNQFLTNQDVAGRGRALSGVKAKAAHSDL